jgi:RHS repeat-associated protein
MRKLFGIIFLILVIFSSVNLVHARRYYDAAIGRWLIPDPALQEREPQWLAKNGYYSVSPYNYCFNNPMIFIDPNGLDSYVFYDSNDFSEQAQSEFVRLSELYDDPVHLIAVESMDNLVEGWKTIGADGVSIDEVSVLMHGDNEGIYLNRVFRTENSPNGMVLDPKGRNYLGFNELSQKDIPTLNLMSCDGSSIAQSLSNQFNATVNAWDGGLSYTNVNTLPLNSTNSFSSADRTNVGLKIYNPRPSRWYTQAYYAWKKGRWPTGAVQTKPIR